MNNRTKQRINGPLKTANFYGYEFLVDSTVLTPRPETEAIVDEVLKLCGKPILPGVKPEKPTLESKNLKILDVGTGSGCIAITLKKKLPEAKIYASDFSPYPLIMTSDNAKKHNVKIHIIFSWLLNAIADDQLPIPDIVVANLPYVDENWDWVNHEALSNEPARALYADDGGLKLIKQLIDESKKYDVKYLILEADPCQHDRVINYAKNKYRLLRKNGFILTFTKN